MQQQAADEREVERAEAFGCELVHRAVDSLDRRAVDLAWRCRTRWPSGPGRRGGRRVGRRRALPVARAGSSRSTATTSAAPSLLHAERPEPVARADVEAALAGQALGNRHLRAPRAQIEPPRVTTPSSSSVWYHPTPRPSRRARCHGRRGYRTPRPAPTTPEPAMDRPRICGRVIAGSMRGDRSVVDGLVLRADAGQASRSAGRGRRSGPAWPGRPRGRSPGRGQRPAPARHRAARRRRRQDRRGSPACRRCRCTPPAYRWPATRPARGRMPLRRTAAR